MITTFFKKISAKCTNFEVSILGLELQVSNLGLEIQVSSLGLELQVLSLELLEKVSVSVSCQNFNHVSVSVSKVTVSTTSLLCGNFLGKHVGKLRLDRWL